MPISTPLNMLPTPSLVEIVDDSIVLISTIGQLPRHHRPDTTLHPRRFVLTWQDKNVAVGDAIRRHYDDHPYDVFTFVVPRTLEVVRALWASPPTIQWASVTTAASIAAEVEEVLAYQ
jgi:hypothetical protein